MTETKHVFDSTTIRGIIILLLPLIKQVLGIDIGTEEINSIFGNIDQLLTIGFTLVGAIMSIYGRIKANNNLSFKFFK